jgi:hypothetical protein
VRFLVRGNRPERFPGLFRVLPRTTPPTQPDELTWLTVVVADALFHWPELEVIGGN